MMDKDPADLLCSQGLQNSQIKLMIIIRNLCNLRLLTLLVRRTNTVP